MVAAVPLAHLVFPELTADAAGSTLASNLLRILLPTVLFLSLAGALSGVLYSLERFTVPAIVSIVWNLTIIAAILLLQDALGVYAVAIGMLVGTLLQLALLAGAMGRAERWIWPGFGLRDPLLRRVLLLMVPITITLGILNFNALIGTWFAQFVSDRAAAEIGYAFRLYQLPQGIFAVTIGTVLFPSLSRFALTREDGRFGDTISFGVRQMVVVSLPFVAWFMVMPEPFVRLVYQRGQFGSEATAEVGTALAFLAIGLLFANANIMLNRGFQSMQRPWLPFYVSLGNVLVMIVLCWLLYRPLGVAGITLQHGRRLGGQLLRPVRAPAPAARLARRPAHPAHRGARSGLRRRPGAVSWLVWQQLQGYAAAGFLPLLAAVLAAVAAGAAVYVALARLFKLDELTAVWGASGGGGRRRRRPGSSTRGRRCGRHDWLAKSFRARSASRDGDGLAIITRPGTTGLRSS